MKSFLFLIIIGLTTFATWNHVNHLHKLEKLSAESAENEREIKKFEGKIKELNLQIQDLRDQTISAATATTLAELEEDYEKQVKSVAKSKLLLDINRVKGQQALTQLENSSPMMGNGGSFRVSQTDQEIANKRHRAEITSARAYLVAVEAEWLKLAAEERELERKYKAARAEAISGY